MQKRSLLFISLAMLLAVILSGCFQGEQSLDKKEEIDPPQNAEAVTIPNWINKILVNRTKIQTRIKQMRTQPRVQWKGNFIYLTLMAW
ncbi:hypothetical protein [Lentibacillus cibarius]|uniref:hypothetical protein n=1 Tax=Lentibacillus cibarius TaxID=2583219 RepID=UPI0026ACB0CB|nr:hypothetical protein [Lentibacillus cibarius]